MEIETPFLIKSTPEGARDFVVPSRMNEGQFYALPQSPQTFKQLLMVSGYDRYFQIVRCFRDEDLRGDRQPEFTQIDCEMAFVEQEDVLHTFEGLTKNLFKAIKGIELDDFPRMTYTEAMNRFGSDKPDIRFGMELQELTDLAQHRDFGVFNQAAYIGAVCIPGGTGDFSSKDLRPPKKAKDLANNLAGMASLSKTVEEIAPVAWAKWTAEGFDSSLKKFYDQDDIKDWFDRAGGKEGDLLVIVAGDRLESQERLGVLRRALGDKYELRDPAVYQPLWVLDFPLLEWKDGRYHAMHHPFTSPKLDQVGLLDTDPGAVFADAYDLTLNGVEIGGGSIRIHDRDLQAKMFEVLGFSAEEAQAQFGFLLGAFEYGAPPHGGIAFGFDRLCALFGGDEFIRDYIAFPKNNKGRDMMIDSPAPIDQEQLDELYIRVNEALITQGTE